jgi:Phage integrase family
VGLVCALLYGTGMRLIEGLRLRVKDVEFSRREILVRFGKGGKDRVTVLPENLIAPLQQQLAKARALHLKDLSEGFGTVWLPDALDAKYPNAPKQWGWQWVFPSATRSADPRTGQVHRHHLNEASVQKAMSVAAKRAGTALDRQGHHGARVVDHLPQARVGRLRGGHGPATASQACHRRQPDQAPHGFAPAAIVPISGSDRYAVTTKPSGFSRRSRSLASTLGWYWYTTLATCRVVASGRLRSVRRTTLS